MMGKQNIFKYLVIPTVSIAFIFFIGLQLFSFYQKDILLQDLGKQIKESAEANYPTSSFFVKDLSFPGLTLKENSRIPFPAASIIKLPILAAAFMAIEQGLISLEERVVINHKDITNGSGRLKTYKLPYVLSFQELLEFMISVSDNTATNKVISLLGFTFINDSFIELGLDQTVLARKMMDFKQRRKGIENYTCSKDIVFILDRVYHRRLVSKKFSELALSFLKKQKVKDRIPRYLPKEVVVAHKTGLERGVVHDAGIVFSRGGNYIICVLAKKGTSFKQAKKFIAQVSLLTYNLYQ